MMGWLEIWPTNPFIRRKMSCKYSKESRSYMCCSWCNDRHTCENSTVYDPKRKISKKNFLIGRMNDVAFVNAIDHMPGVAWFNPYTHIIKTFSREEIFNMSEKEVENLISLAKEIINEGKYDDTKDDTLFNIYLDK